jgi:hypothetical protein
MQDFKKPTGKRKKNSQLVFASWPLRRRTDEEIIRLCGNGLLQ